MSHIPVSGRRGNMTSHQTGDVSVSKDVHVWEDVVSTAGAHRRKRGIKSSMCPRFEKVHDGSAKRS